ncbi:MULTISPECIES: DUF6730 family protein [Maribacter]|uniref:Uncharacterized protein n=2 Tax=Maribacter TaxID=252356 RepID=A0A1H4NQH6_9FLAO|nr:MULTISPECIES: DUF6730 family protein [Maribacter]SEB97501.1 hypothetical protein SAMN05192540_2030 [Maribacter dokdonensis]VXB83304.1 conserved hypothetical protein [Maribacter litoralis]
MAKIDDLAELLVEEISDFKVQLQRMEELSVQLQLIKIKPDITTIQSAISAPLKEQELILKNQNKELGKITKKLTKSNHYPNWLLILFSTILLSCFLFIGISIFQLKQVEESNQEYYIKGQKEVINHFNKFIESNPEAKEMYQKWETNLK